MKTTRLKLTVYYNKEDEVFCHCSGDFYKTCSLRQINELPCKESIVSISPIERDASDYDAQESIRSMNENLSDLQHSLRGISETGYKI